LLSKWWAEGAGKKIPQGNEMAKSAFPSYRVLEPIREQVKAD
jgi:hypothetical protein